MKFSFEFLFFTMNLMGLFQDSELSEVSSATTTINRINEMTTLQDPSPPNHENPMNTEKNQMGIRMDHVENEVSSLKTENKALLERISRLEAGEASCKEGTAKNEQSHFILKRQTAGQNSNNKTPTPRAQQEKCASSANQCTYFYPDFPDRNRKKNSSKKPIQSMDNSSSSTSETISPNKMPSSCKDLQLLGHSLNGFYSVQGIGKDSSSKIETIFCQFDLEQSSANEKRIGFVQLKNVDVFFQAKSLKRWKGSQQLLTYVEEKLNVGNAFNIFKGIFTTRVNGIYSFFFSTRQASKSQSMLHIRVNRDEVNSLNGPKDCLNCEITLHSTLKLKAGDEVDIFIEYGYLQLADTYFMGWLQQEEIPMPVATNETTNTLN